MEAVTSIPFLKARACDAHKGNFGRVLVVGGSKGMIGAPALAVDAALRSGSGLVTVACPECIHLSVACLVPCATSIALKDNGEYISSAGVSELRDIAFRQKLFDVIAIGPGLGQVEMICDFIFECVEKDIPLVIDADGLNMLAQSDWKGKLGGKCIVTPHPGELARMMHCTTSQVQSDRARYAINCASDMCGADGGKSICVLKGHGTVVTDGERMYVNGTGNPGMATGGSGDVLTGIIASLVGQGYSCFDSSVLGVYIHGLAGDIGANKLGEISLIASDLIKFLPEAFLKAQAFRDREN